MPDLSLVVIGRDGRPVDLGDQRPWRWTVESYLRAIEAGVFPPDLRAELLDGIVIEKHVKGSVTETVTETLLATLRAAAADEPFAVLPHGMISADEPYLSCDAVVVRGSAEPTSRRPVAPGEVALACEVAEFNLYYDRTVKYAALARAGIPEYWIVDVPHRRLSVFTQPQPTGTYDQERTFADGEAYAHEVFGEIAVGALLQ